MAETVSPPEVVKRWYVVRVATGKEDRVKKTLDKRIEVEGFRDYISSVVIPMERVSEMRSGKRRVREVKIYPGYILLQMVYDITHPESWYFVRSTPGITGFLGGDEPAPLNDEEMEKILRTSEETQGSPKIKVQFKKGDTVRIKEGAFENFEGQVEEVVPDRGLLKVIINIFGRPTEVELEYWQAEIV